MPDGTTTCSLCGRVVFEKDVNSGGRCVDCAGVRADDKDEDDE
jgi:hypothetical protein